MKLVVEMINGTKIRFEAEKVDEIGEPFSTALRSNRFLILNEPDGTILGIVNPEHVIGIFPYVIRREP